MADEKLREDYEYARKGLNQWKKPLTVEIIIFKDNIIIQQMVALFSFKKDAHYLGGTTSW